MLKSNGVLIAFVLLAAIIAGCAKEAPIAPPPIQQSASVAPQSAPVLPPSYPALAGPVVQSATGSMPIVQGR